MSSEAVTRDDRELQKVMYLIAELLGMLKRCRSDLRRSSQIQKEIFAVADRIEYLTQEYEYMLIGPAAQQPDLYELSFRPLCPDCIREAKESRRVSKPTETTVIPP